MQAPPNHLRAGDYYNWQSEFADYPATDWDLVWYFTADGQENQSVTATATGTAFDGALGAEDSVHFQPATYRWYARVTEKAGSEVHTIAEGVSFVTRDPNEDYGPSFAERMLAAIRAVQLKRAGMEYNTGDLEGTTYDFKTDAELRAAESFYMARARHDKRSREARERGAPFKPGKGHFAPSN